MNPVIAKLHEAQLRKDLPEFRPGDTVRVNVRLKEGEGEKEKERLQAFEVRRARLYYLRDLRGKAARIKRAAREEVAAVATAGAETKA
jgi:ribosomal protein L19